MLVTRGHKNAKFNKELLSKFEKEIKVEKKTKGEKDNSILYDGAEFSDEFFPLLISAPWGGIDIMSVPGADLLHVTQSARIII